MNKKIFATALIALAAFVSTGASASIGASAAITYGDSVVSSAQTDNALVNPGGTSRGNDLTIQAGNATVIPADSEIIIRLPAGLNFSGAPTYAVTPATPTEGLTLKDNTEFGDPTLGEDVGVGLFDTNADGGMDRAVVTVSSAAGAGDTLTVSVNVIANSDATVGTKTASIIVNRGLAQTRDVVVVTSDVITGVISSSGDDLVTVDQQAYPYLLVGTATFGVVIPAGAENGDTVTITPNGKVQWDMLSQLSISGIFTPINLEPLTGTILVTTAQTIVATGTDTVTLLVQGAPTGGFANDVIVELTLTSAGILSGSFEGNYGLTIAGTAGVAGTADLFAVKENASSAALVSGEKLTSIVTGSSAAQTLPTFVITENFDQDAFSLSAPSITLTAGAGLKFGTSTITVTDGGASFSYATLSSNDTVMDIYFTANMAVTKTVTISGVQGTVSVAGDVTMKVTGGLPSSPNSTFAVATGVPVGTVTVAGPTGTLPQVGSTSGGTTTFTLSESTYGSITRSAYKEKVTTTGEEVTKSFFRVTPTNADITSVTITPTGSYTVGADPTFGPGSGVPTGACGVESIGASTWICEVVTESTGLAAGTDTVTVQIGYTADGMVGDTISMSLDGNAGVAGSGDVATIVETTEAKVSGPIKVVKEGLTTIQGVSTFTIEEKFTGAISSGAFRVIAPAGVVFAQPLLGGATSIVDTFAPNDTLRFSTSAVSTIFVQANVIVSSGVTGYISFDIVDGDIDGSFKTNIVGESLDVAYADKTLTDLSAGADVAVTPGFSKSSNVVTGGLIGDGYSVMSSNTATVTASIANVGGSQTLTITGVAAGAANVTVTDELGATDVVAVTVSAGAAIPDAEKGAKGVGDRTGVTFSAGATSDGGFTYGTTFTVDDEVSIIAVIGVDSTDVGSAGATHVAAKLEGNVFVYLDEDGNFADWDTSGLPGANIVTDSLEASYTVTVVDGQKLPAGEHRFALAYSTGGEVIYTGKAIVITITELTAQEPI